MVSGDANAAAGQMNLQRFVNFFGWYLSDGLLSENARLAAGLFRLSYMVDDIIAAILRPQNERPSENRYYGFQTAFICIACLA